MFLWDLSQFMLQFLRTRRAEWCVIMLLIVGLQSELDPVYIYQTTARLLCIQHLRLGALI